MASTTAGLELDDHSTNEELRLTHPSYPGWFVTIIPEVPDAIKLLKEGVAVPGIVSDVYNAKRGVTPAFAADDVMNIQLSGIRVTRVGSGA